MVVGGAAHRVSCDSDYNHTLRGRRKERVLLEQAERSIDVLSGSSITLSSQVGSLARMGSVTQLRNNA